MTLDEAKIAFAIEAAPRDPFSQYVKQVVTGEKDWPAAGGADPAVVEAERRRLAQELFDGIELVDLVGHSTPRGCCLKLGDWVLTPDEAARLASYLPKTVKAVRLIGCKTVSTDEGRAAAAAFTQYGMEAYGTLNKVYTTHFDAAGVKRGAEGPPLLGFYPEGRDSWPPPMGTPGSGRRPLALRILLLVGWVIALPILGPLWLVARLARLMRAAICWLYWCGYRRQVVRRSTAPGDPRARIAELLRAEGEPMPGLLTEPLLVFEVASGSETWTLEILFDFEHARFYTGASSAAERHRVYAVRGFGWIAKTPLEAYLERAPAGVTVTSRHEEAGDRCGRVPARGAGAEAPTGARAPAAA
jgi:hypothetical protein